ncbi:MAG: uroporphyrinogen-III synthase [Nitrospiraceae bacterium]|nr:uroporphyrinogen-III synthase [Nitrospiraceae bacterium]
MNANNIKILITREDSAEFDPLRNFGAEIIKFPCIEIIPPENYDALDNAIEKIETYDWIIFTSRNAVKYFIKRFSALNKEIELIKKIKVCAVGSKTAEEIERYGIKVSLIPDKFNAEGLINVFPNPKGMRFLLPRAENAREIFPGKMRELGGEIDVPVTYRTVMPEIKAEKVKKLLSEIRLSRKIGREFMAVFTSSSAFNNFIKIIGEDSKALLEDVTIAVIGNVTAKAVEKAGFKVDIMPSEFTIEAMNREIISFIQKGDKKLDEKQKEMLS